MPYVRTRLGRWFYEERGAARSRRTPASSSGRASYRRGHVEAPDRAARGARARASSSTRPGTARARCRRLFSLEDNADALIDAFGELRIDRAVMVGLSWGGMLGMRMALQHASRVAALALFDTSAEPEDRRAPSSTASSSSFDRRFGMPPALFEAQIAPAFFCDESLARAARRGRALPAQRQRLRRGRAWRAPRSRVVVHRRDITARLARHPRADARRVRPRGPRDRAGRTPSASRGASPGRASRGSRARATSRPLEQPEAVNGAARPVRARAAAAERAAAALLAAAARQPPETARTCRSAASGVARRRRRPHEAACRRSCRPEFVAQSLAIEQPHLPCSRLPCAASAVCRRRCTRRRRPLAVAVAACAAAYTRSQAHGPRDRAVACNRAAAPGVPSRRVREPTGSRCWRRSSRCTESARPAGGAARVARAG